MALPCQVSIYLPFSALNKIIYSGVIVLQYKLMLVETSDSFEFFITAQVKILGQDLNVFDCQRINQKTLLVWELGTFCFTSNPEDLNIDIDAHDLKLKRLQHLTIFTYYNNDY